MPKMLDLLSLMVLMDPQRLVCQSTPDYKSCFCKDHKNQAVELREQSDSIDGNTTLPRNFKQGYPIPELVLTKKTTRKETYYQV